MEDNAPECTVVRNSGGKKGRKWKRRKYKRREWVDGKWEYWYGKDRKMKYFRGKYWRTIHHKRNNAEPFRKRKWPSDRVGHRTGEMQREVIREMGEEIKKEILEGKSAKEIKVSNPENIPNFKEAGDKIIKSIMKEIKGKEEIEQMEIFNKTVSSFVKKAYKLWEEVPAEEKVIKKYSKDLLRSATGMVDQWRKSIMNIHELKYGKTLHVDEKRGAFEEEVDRIEAAIDITPEEEKKEVKEIESGDTGEKQGS